MYIDSENLYDWSLSKYLPYKDYDITKTTNIEDLWTLPDKSDNGYAVYINLKHHDNKRKNKIHFILSRI